MKSKKILELNVTAELLTNDEVLVTITNGNNAVTAMTAKASKEKPIASIVQDYILNYVKTAR